MEGRRQAYWCLLSSDRVSGQAVSDLREETTAAGSLIRLHLGYGRVFGFRESEVKAYDDV
jgi:hypothetical protein